LGWRLRCSLQLSESMENRRRSLQSLDEGPATVDVADTIVLI